VKKHKILILGGSEIAYQLAHKLQSLPLITISSLAGRTKNPRLPTGIYRIGGFGGVEGLVNFLQTNNIKLIIDATHPFARKMQINAHMASSISKIPLLRLQRPLWQQQPEDEWIEIGDEAEACTVLPKESTVFLALGRQYLQVFSTCHDVKFIARMLEKPPNLANFTNLKIILSPPRSVKNEINLLRDEKIDIIVCRNSGAQASYGKIIAARHLKIRVLIITPPKPINIIPTLSTIEEAFEAILSNFRNMY